MKKSYKPNIIKECLPSRFHLMAWSDVVWRGVDYSVDSYGLDLPPELNYKFIPAQTSERVKKLLELADTLYGQEHAPCLNPDTPKVIKLVDTMLAAVESVLLKSLEERDAAKDGCDNDT
jgi:hypothetical protein